MKLSTTVVVIVLFLVSIAQFLRLVLRVRVVANGFEIPLWPSAIACAVAAILAIWLWTENKGLPRT